MENWGDQGISSLAMELFGDYLARREAGEVVDLAALSARHPEVARELEELDSQHRRLYAQGVFVASAIDPHAARPSGGGLGELERVLSRLAGREASYRRYRILGVIAKGGMGIVLRVYDRDLRRELAMKVLKNRAAGRRGTPGFDVARAGRLLDEAQITAQLDHPGIPPIHEVGLAPDGELYFTMKLISGARTLADVLARHHAPREAPSSAEWSLPRLLALVQRACEAVAYAHERGVIHRDLKPANILVGDFGEVYVTDWGVARVLGTVRVRAAADRGRARQVRSFRSDQKRGHLETPLATLSGRTVGTPEYMSPEQAQGRLDVLDRRSDVFSMGALLYHVLSGHPPFRRERPMNDAERLGQVAFGTPRPLRALVPSVPPELEAICERAMACAQEQRYADMQALARDLGAYLEGRVVRAYETGPLAELRKWVQRNRGLAAVGGVAALSLVVGLILFLQWRSSETLAALRGRARDDAVDQVRIQLAQQGLSEGDSAGRESLLHCSERARHWEWKHLWSRSDSSLACYQVHGKAIFDVVWGPSGDWAITAWDDGTWRKWRPTTATELLRSEPQGEPIRALALAPDGSILATLGPQSLALWDTDSGEALGEFQALSLPSGPAQRRSICFAPDGSVFASLGADQRVRIWGLDGEQAAEWPSGIDEGVLAWVEDELLLAGYTNSGSLGAGSLTALDPLTGRRLRSWPVAGGALFAFDVDEVHRRVAIGSLDGGVRLFGLDGRQQWVSSEHRGAVLGLAFDRSGSWLASGSMDRSVRAWNLEAGTRATVLAGHADAVLGVAFGPAPSEGEPPLLVTTSKDHTARTWNPQQEPGITLLAGNYRLGTVAFSPDGRFVAAGTDSSLVQVWSVDEALALATLRGHVQPVNDLAWTPDSRTLISASADQTLRLWNVEQATGALLGEHGSDVTGVVLDVAGASAYSASTDGTIRRWDLAGRAESIVLHRGAEALTCLARSSDGRQLVAGTVSGVILQIDPERRGVSRSLEGSPGPITRLAFSPGGTLAIGSEDGSIHLRHLDSPGVVELNHAGPVCGLDFSSDGLRLFSAAEDRSLIVWGTNGQPLASFPIASQPLDLAFAPGGERLATAHMDGTLRMWESRPPSELEPERLRTRELSRSLTARVSGLFDQHVHTGRVLAAIDALEGLTPEERRIARALAAGHVNDPAAKATHALRRVLESTDRARYETARRWIDAAVEEEPYSTRWKLIRGAVLARLDESEAALELLPGHASPQDPDPDCRLASQALRVKCLCAVGLSEEARDCAASLRAFVAQRADWSGNPVVQRLMGEVEGWLSSAEVR